MKKERFYLYALLGGTLLNIALSIVLGKYVFTKNPAVGVAIGTSITDLLILVFLVSVSWKWIKKAIFNLNSLKIFLVAVAIAVFSFFIKDPIYSLLIHFHDTETRNTKINKSVIEVPIATPTAGFFVKTYLPKTIDKAIFNKVPPNNA